MVHAVAARDWRDGPAAGYRLLAHRAGHGGLRQRLAGRAYRSDALGPDHPDVQLPQRPARLACRQFAVVGLADGSQARLVREHHLRQRHRLDDLRRRQSGAVVDGHCRHGLRLLAGLQAAQPGPDADCRGLLLAMAVVVAYRSGRVPVPLLHGPSLLPVSACLLPRRAVAWPIATNLAAGQGFRSRGAALPGRRVAAQVPVVRPRSGQHVRLLRQLHLRLGDGRRPCRDARAADRRRPSCRAGRAGLSPVASRAPPERRPGRPSVDPPAARAGRGRRRAAVVARPERAA